MQSRASSPLPLAPGLVPLAGVGGAQINNEILVGQEIAFRGESGKVCCRMTAAASSVAVAQVRQTSTGQHTMGAGQQQERSAAAAVAAVPVPVIRPSGEGRPARSWS
ncbi:hypothetical protein GCM10018780_24390 [Streptomyces lanatus]|nr:hypothetical protein GCM10018780_24390 [Streptomyces lanatus]